MINFALAVFFLIITPGPGVLSTAGIGAAFGWGTGLKYIFGLFLGTNLVAIAVITGLSVWVISNPVLRLSLLSLSSIYLLFLAFKIATAGKEMTFSSPNSKPGVLAGFLLQPINPKAYVVNTILFSGFVLFPDKIHLEIFLKLLILNTIWIIIHVFWLFLGLSLNKLNLGPKATHRINFTLALFLVFVVVLAVVSAIK
ncbi:MAG: LysE family transporter [Paracoccaceae bacterium]|nr:LysE family transporter [Paracoccaceae bacterium]